MKGWTHKKHGARTANDEKGDLFQATIKPNQTKPNQTKPNETRIKSNQIKSNHLGEQQQMVCFFIRHSTHDECMLYQQIQCRLINHATSVPAPKGPEKRVPEALIAPHPLPLHLD
jgi:hypothetical protein